MVDGDAEAGAGVDLDVGAADPDAGVIPPGFWDKATVRLPRNTQQITLRLDTEIIGWFKRTGKGDQSRMGAVLRSYVEAKRKRS